MLSVYIPNFNRIELLLRAVNSVLIAIKHSGESIKLTVVDDCSTHQDVLKVLDEISRKEGVAVIRHTQNKGQISNLNFCVNHCETEWIHILHSDDFIEKDFYKETISLIEEYPNSVAAFCVTNYIRMGKKIGTSEMLSPERSKLDLLPSLFERQLIQTPSIIWRPRVNNEAHYFANIPAMEDWELWVRLAALGSFAFTPRNFANYNISNNSNTQGTLLLGERENTARDLLAMWYARHRDVRIYSKGERNAFRAICRQYSSLEFRSFLIGVYRLIRKSKFFCTKYTVLKIALFVVYGKIAAAVSK